MPRGHYAAAIVRGSHEGLTMLAESATGLLAGYICRQLRDSGETIDVSTQVLWSGFPIFQRTANRNSKQTGLLGDIQSCERASPRQSLRVH